MARLASVGCRRCQSEPLRRIGTLAIVVGNHAVSWDADPASFGVRGFSLEGSMRDSAQARALLALVDNPERRVGVAGTVGVLEWLDAGDEYATMRGWVLLQGCTYEDGPRSGDGDFDFGPFRLRGASLGWRHEPVIVRGSRALPNAYGLTPRAVVVQPFWGPKIGGEPFSADPGGVPFSREYDANTGMHLADIDVPEARNLRLNVATIGTSDPMDKVVRFAFEHAKTPPEWAVLRGGECRAYDRREQEFLFGPGPAPLVPTDLLVGNGLVRLWCGQWGGPAYVQVQAFAAGAWREAGCLWINGRDLTSTVIRARLGRVTPDAVTLVLDLDGGLGPVHLSLRRGERMIHVRHGEGIGPVDARTRVLEWTGVPPYRLVDGTGSMPTPVTEAGRFGRAYRDPSAGRFGWYVRQIDPAHFGASIYWAPDSDSDAQPDSDLFTFRDEDGVVVMRLHWEASSKRLKLDHLPNTVLASDVLNFPAGRWIYASGHFADCEGLGLTWDAGAQIVGDTAWGDGDWGDGVWGGSQAVSGISSVLDAGNRDPGTAHGRLDLLVLGHANGLLDEVVAYDGWLTPAERVAVAAQPTPYSGAPDPEGKAVLRLHFDLEPATFGSAVISGRRYETTTEGGTTAQPIGGGLLRTVMSLDAGATATGTGLRLLQFGATTSRMGAALTLPAAEDDVADHHNQLAADSFQQVRAR
jgi:hypothetical protein